MHDVLIRNGRIVDGTGRAPYHGDIAIQDGRIVAIEKSLGENARETFDADGRVVTPGVVDIHTHYDGQVSWDSELRPSVAHGVTTVVMGNCGVGFAPVIPGREDWLIQLMEGVEDIPGTALAEGIDWCWESFPQYLDVIGERHYTMDVGAQIPHGALRAYVMGERGANDDPATPDELATMARLAREAVAAGAVGFSTSRIQAHQALDGRPVPGTVAPEAELLAIARAMGEAGAGVFEVIPSGILGTIPGIPVDRVRPHDELELMRRLALASGRPLTFLLIQTHSDPEVYRELLELQDKAWAEGARVTAQFAVRPGGLLSSFEAYHAFLRRPTYMKLAGLPFEARIAELRKPEVRGAILAEDDVPVSSTAVMDNTHKIFQGQLHQMFPLGPIPDYEPERARSVLEQARARGEEPLACLYDWMLEDGGKAPVIALAANFATADHRAIETMLRNAHAVPGLGDGGAHVRFICDSSGPSYLLAHWARDRRRGARFPLEYLVKKQTHDTAALYGLRDRGTLEVGKRADLNVIDLDALAIPAPFMLHDLPGGGSRFVQDATGYAATYVNGVATRKDDRDTGARPGRLIRNARA